MNATKGYFSLVQYCPDIARQEAANVGVVLFCQEHRFIKAKIIKNNHRIRRFFGEEADNYQHLNAMKEALANRLRVEESNFVTLEDLLSFVATRANKVILTDPKPVKVLNPSEDLEALYKELVLEPSRPLSIQSALPLRKRLDQVLMGADVRRFMRTKIKVHVAALNEELEMPYGYQNGRFNLIQPMEFTQQSEARIKSAACKTAMEGLSLFRHGDPKLGSLQLVVVAQFVDTQPDTASLVKNIFSEGSVEMFTPDNLDDLRQEIIKNGKPAPLEHGLFD
jgi:hypothetical protein